MKVTIIMPALALLALASSALSAKGLANGDLNKGANNLPDSWTVNACTGAQAAWEPNAGIKNSGCLSITVTAPSKEEGITWEQDVQLEPYKAYLFTGYIKGNEIKLAIPDQNAKETGPSLATSMWLCDTMRLKKSPTSTGTFGWTKFAIDFATGPDGKATIYCKFGRNNMVGKAYFDNLMVKPNPDTEKFESKHMVLNLWKDEIATATREGVIQRLKNADRLYEAYKDLTGHEPGKEKSSAYAPKLWGIEAMGWSGNPLLWIADQEWMKTYWRQPDYCAEIYLHELAHNFDIRGAAYDMHFSELMFYYACEKCNFVIGEDKGPHQGKDVRYRWELRGAQAGVPDPAYVIYKLIPFIDQVGWEPIKQTYRSYLNKPIPGLPGPNPEDYENRWGKFKTFFDRLSFFSKRDAWSIFTKEEIADVERCYTDPRIEPTQTPADVSSDVTTIWLSDLKWDSVKVGYGGPCRNYNEASFPLRSYERSHKKGLGTHAPANTTFNLGGKWKKLDVYVGLIARSKGSVIFVVNGDGKELYRSDKVTDQKERHITLDLTGVNKMELIVEDAGDGRTWDWGMWLSPQLSR
ncbi:MAG: NPCBM/NEW2 domain-containing protein [Armatimonadetes bacterium]|nr:NPCBM/NEW2 domain-containing protein [Armatimonadota bacterium]